MIYSSQTRRSTAQMFAGALMLSVLAAGCQIELPGDPGDPPPPPPPPPPTDVFASWELFSDRSNCFAVGDTFDRIASCPEPFFTNEQIFVRFFVDSFPARAVGIEFALDCPADIDFVFQDENLLEFGFIPTDSATCFLTTFTFLDDGSVEDFTLNVEILDSDVPPPPPPPPPPSPNNALWDLFFETGECRAFPGQDFADCSTSIPNNAVVTGFVQLEFPNPQNRAFGIRDNCNGTFLDIFSDQFGFINFFWVPPAAGDFCEISVISVTEEGRIEESRIAVPLGGDLPPPPPPPPPPVDALVFWNLLSQTGDCNVSSEAPEPCRTPFLANETVQVLASMEWLVEPGDVELFSTCGGDFNFFLVDPFLIDAQWIPPAGINGTCELVILAQNADGSAFESQLSLAVVDELPAQAE